MYFKEIKDKLTNMFREQEPTKKKKKRADLKKIYLEIKIYN